MARKTLIYPICEKAIRTTINVSVYPSLKYISKQYPSFSLSLSLSLSLSFSTISVYPTPRAIVHCAQIRKYFFNLTRIHYIVPLLYLQCRLLFFKYALLVFINISHSWETFKHKKIYQKPQLRIRLYQMCRILLCGNCI